jgi:hypothetical protein
VYGKILDLANESLGHWRELIDHWTVPTGAPIPGKFGKFYSQGKGEIFFGKNGLIGQAIEAVGIQNTENNRANYLYAMECSPFNDAVYNVDLDAAGLQNRSRTWWPRGISQTPRYVDNYQRAIIGKSFKRGSGNDFAMAWFPKAEATQDGEFTIVMWPDGTSAINPPAEVMALGFENVPPKQYGCGSTNYAGSKLQIS